MLLLLLIGLSAARAPVELDSRDAFEAGQRALATGNARVAVSHFLNAKTKAPGWGLAHLYWAMAMHEHDPADAGMLPVLERAEDLLGTNPRVHYYLGATLERQERWRSSASAYARAMVLRPGFRDAEFRRAGCLQRAGADDEAIAAFRLLLLRVPGHLAAYASLARLFERNFRLVEAERALLRVAGLQPASAYPRYQLALFYQRIGESAKARRMQRSAEALDPRPKRKMRPLRKSPS